MFKTQFNCAPYVAPSNLKEINNLSQRFLLQVHSVLISEIFPQITVLHYFSMKVNLTDFLQKIEAAGGKTRKFPHCEASINI